jgi:hypothetical protein
MNKTMLVALWLLWSATGCTSTNWLDTRGVSAPLSRSTAQPLPPGPISADIAEANNAHRVAEAVWDEMDRDQQKDPAPPTAKEPKKR